MAPTQNILGKHALASTGSTGNATHSAVEIKRGDSHVAAVQFVVEAVGATPTVTWKAQGSLDGTNWYDLAYITDASGTEAVTTRTATAVGAQVNFLSRATERQYK